MLVNSLKRSTAWTYRIRNHMLQYVPTCIYTDRADDMITIIIALIIISSRDVHVYRGGGGCTGMWGGGGGVHWDSSPPG